MNEFVVHACEQVLRFTTVANWDDLTPERKVQLSFNMGVFALGLGLSKEEGYDSLAVAAKGGKTVRELHEHIRYLVNSHAVAINEERVLKPF
jgi:hypothetical protein